MALEASQLAKLLKLRAVGWSQQEIADAIGTSQQVVAYQLRKLKEESMKKDPEDVFRELSIAGIPDISMEVVEDMTFEGNRLAAEYKDVCTVKVPCTPEGLKTCKELSDNGVRVNVTLIFSQAQAILAAKAGAAYVSPFVGRVDDNSFGGLCLVKDIAKVFREHMVRTEVLAASVRDVRSVGRAFEYGADIVTMPPTVFEKMYNHILTDKGLELFQADYEAVLGINS